MLFVAISSIRAYPCLSVVIPPIMTSSTVPTYARVEILANAPSCAGATCKTPNSPARNNSAGLTAPLGEARAASLKRRILGVIDTRGMAHFIKTNGVLRILLETFIINTKFSLKSALETCFWPC